MAHGGQRRVCLVWLAGVRFVCGRARVEPAWTSGQDSTRRQQAEELPSDSATEGPSDADQHAAESNVATKQRHASMWLLAWTCQVVAAGERLGDWLLKRDSASARPLDLMPNPTQPRAMTHTDTHRQHTWRHSMPYVRMVEAAVGVRGSGKNEETGEEGQKT